MHITTCFFHSYKCMYMRVSKNDCTNEIKSRYWTQKYISISAIYFNTHVYISLMFSLFYMSLWGGEGRILNHYRNNLEKYLLLSGSGLDAYLQLSDVSLDPYFNRVVDIFGKRLQIPLGSICQNGLDNMHIFWNAWLF